MASTELDTSVLELLDFEPPCDGCPVVAGCGRPATWERVTTDGCQHLNHSLLCDEHKAESVHRDGLHPNLSRWCSVCRKPYGDIYWRPLHG